jgi:hypothetical protein
MRGAMRSPPDGNFGRQKRGLPVPTPTSVPTTPSVDGSAPATPGSAVPDPAPKKKARVPKAEEPVTPLAKGRDMAGRLL